MCCLSLSSVTKTEVKTPKHCNKVEKAKAAETPGKARAKSQKLRGVSLCLFGVSMLNSVIMITEFNILTPNRQRETPLNFCDLARALPGVSAAFAFSTLLQCFGVLTSVLVTELRLRQHIPSTYQNLAVMLDICYKSCCKYSLNALRAASHP